MTDPLPLADRVRALTGADHKIDCEIAIATGQIPQGYTLSPTDAGDDHYEPPRGVRRSDWFVPYYTASLDAVIALAERVLPGCEYEITTLYGVAMVRLPLNFTDIPYETECRKDGNVVLAFLAALLTAKAGDEHD